MGRRLILNVCNVVLYCLLHAVLSVCFCTDNFVMEPLNLQIHKYSIGRSRCNKALLCFMPPNISNHSTNAL